MSSSYFEDDGAEPPAAHAAAAATTTVEDDIDRLIEQQLQSRRGQQDDEELARHQRGAPPQAPPTHHADPTSDISRGMDEEPNEEEVVGGGVEEQNEVDDETAASAIAMEKKIAEEVARREALMQAEIERKAQAEIARRIALEEEQAEKRRQQEEDAAIQAEIERRAQIELAKREALIQADVERRAQEELARREAARAAKEAEIQRRAEEEIARRLEERKKLEDAEFERRMEEEVKRRVAETEKRLREQVDERVRGATQVVLASAAVAANSTDEIAAASSKLATAARGEAARAAKNAKDAVLSAQTELDADPRVQDGKKSFAAGISRLSAAAKQAADNAEAHATAAASNVTSDPRFKVGKFVAESVANDVLDKAASNKSLQQAVAQAATVASSAKNTAGALRDEAERAATDVSKRVTRAAAAAVASPLTPPAGAATEENRDGDENDDDDDDCNDESYSTVSEEEDDDDVSAGCNTTTGTVADDDRPVVHVSNNGIFSSANNTSELNNSVLAELQNPQAIPYDRFEQFAAEETKANGITVEKTKHRHRLDVKTYATKREEGRCLRPSSENPPRHSHLSIQLGFFAAKQTIIDCAVTKPTIVDREGESVGSRRLSQAGFFFESELLKDPLVVQNVEGLPYEDESEAFVSPEEIRRDARQAVLAATSRFTYGDPLQVWDKTRGRRMEPAASSMKQTPTPNSGATAGILTVTTGHTTGRFWVSEIETRKPTPAVSPFHGGVLYKFSFPEITTQLEVLNGPGLDPLFFNAAIYSVTANGAVKITETFTFDHNGTLFYPHKLATPHLQQRSAVTFIPNEHVTGNVYLIIRVLRPSIEDFDEYVDMYVRPDRWKMHHIAPYKQETQKLTMHSDVLEEMGWTWITLNATGKLLQGPAVIDKLYRAPKILTDGQIPEYFVNDKKRASECKVMPVKILVDFKDVTANEVSFVPSGGSGRDDDPSIHPENTISLFDPDSRGAKTETHRYINCSLPILNAGFFTAYQNLLYLRLQSIKVGALVGAGKIPSTHKTYVLHITLKEDDDSECSGDVGGIPAFFAGSLGSTALLTGAYSTTIHNARDVDVVDDFKIQLPLVLTTKHHLFFTLYAAQFKKGSAATKFHRIGCAVMPLLSDKKLMSPEIAASIDNAGTCKFSLYVGQGIDMTLLLADQATALGKGYIAKMRQLPPSAFLNNNMSVVKVSTTCRSTVYAVNSVVSRIFEHIPLCMAAIRRDDGIFRSCGTLTTTFDATSSHHVGSGSSSLVQDEDDATAPRESAHDIINKSALSLPLAEIMAFFPMIVSYLLATIASPSASIDLGVRRRALVALTDVCHKAQQYDLSVKSAALKRQSSSSSNSRTGGPAAPLGPIKTCLSTLLYQFITNDLLYDAGQYKERQLFPVYAAVAEVWSSELRAVFGGSGGGSLGQGQIAKLSELSWFYLDLILRSLYLDASEPARRKIPVTDRFDRSFYEQLRVLVSLLADRMVAYQGVQLVQRLALFVRNLAHVCDRGEILRLMAVLVSTLDKQQVVFNTQTAIRILLDDDDVIQLMWPSTRTVSPQFLLRIVLPPLFAHCTNSSRDARLGAISTLHNFLVRLVNSATISAQQLEYVASGIVTGCLGELAVQWQAYRALHDKPGVSEKSTQQQQQQLQSTLVQSNEERRQLLAIVTWAIYSAPASVTRTWLQVIGQKHVSGFLLMLADAQSAFRFNAGKDKVDIPIIVEHMREPLALWDARHAALQNMLAVRLASDIAADYAKDLQGVHLEKMPAIVFPFFHLLESLMSLQNSTATLQTALAVMYQAVTGIFPELISRKAKMSSGVVLLTFRMMTHSCFLVRRIASELFYEITCRYHELCGGLTRVKSLTAGALVSVAESKARDLRLAGIHVDAELGALRERAATEKYESSPKSYRDRFVDDVVSAAAGEGDTSASSGDSGVKYKYTIIPQKLTVERILPVSQILSGPNGLLTGQRATDFPSEFRSLTLTMGSLFSDVLRLQVDTTMKFKEERCDAYYTVALNFLKQNSVREFLRWLTRLFELHRSNNSHAEAGMTLALMAGVAFRATEVFYAAKGADTKGARMPYAILSHVFWHDYIRLLPELDDIFPLQAACAVVVDWTVVPDDSVFTLEGQIKCLKEAAECFDAATYYEFSISAARVVEQFVRAKRDYKASSVVFGALQTWSGGIVSNVKRQNCRYFFVWLRMEKEVAKVSGRKKKLHHIDSEEDAAEDEEDDATAKIAGGAAALPIKRIVKVEPQTTVDGFKKYMADFASSVLGGLPDLVLMTDELVETLPPQASAAALPSGIASRPSSKKVKMVVKDVNRCLVTVHEVAPSFDDVVASPQRFSDKSFPIHTFTNALVIKERGSSSAASPMPQPQRGAKNTSTSVDVLAERLHICTHSTERSFPSMTEAVNVDKTTVKLLDCFDTAIQYIDKELDVLEAAAQQDLLQTIQKVLTPRGITPAGFYFKEVVRNLHSDERIVSRVRELLVSAREKLSRCEDTINKMPEVYAQVIKGLTDIECALIESGASNTLPAN